VWAFTYAQLRHFAIRATSHRAEDYENAFRVSGRRVFHWSAAVILMVMLEASKADEWTQYRGPRHDGSQPNSFAPTGRKTPTQDLETRLGTWIEFLFH
jgi:hypothetical protein